MDDVLRLIEDFQQAVCLWRTETLLGFDEPARLRTEARVTELKEALLMAILAISG